MASSATVGVLRVLLSMNTAEFEAGAKRAADAMGVWQKNLNQIGRQAHTVGAALTKTLTVPIVAAFAGSAKAAIDFESSFANVAKTVDGVADRSGNLTKAGKELALTFRNMAKEIPKTTDELTAIAALGGQMGVPIKQLEFFTKNVAALGVAVDGISTEDAAAGLAQIGNITGQGTANIDKMASALVHLGNSSNATEGDILEFTKRLAGAGHAVGMTVPEIMALGTAMANVGINAEAGGTAMSTVIGKISKAVSTGSEALSEFAKVANMSAEQFASVWKTSPVEALNAFVSGLGTMRDRGVDLNLTMGELGTEGIRVADTLKRLAGAGDGIAKSLVIANEGFAAGNKHLEEAEKKYATTANQIKLFWNQVKDVGITIGTAFLPAIKSATQTLGALLPVIDTLAKGFAMLPGPIQMGATGMGLALAAVGPLVYGFGSLARSSGDLAGAFAKKGIAMQALTKAFNAFGGTASSVLTWVTRIGAAARASGLLFAGLSAAVIGIAVPVALAVITEHLRKINEELDQMIEASKVIGRPVINADEARRILSAREAGAAGQPLKSKPFEPPTVDEAAAWTKAKGAAEAYEGQVLKVTIAQKDANAEFASTRNLTVDQVQAMAKMSGAAQTYAGGVMQIGQAQKAAASSTDGLTAKLDGLAQQIKAADAVIDQLDASTRQKLAKAILSGAFSMEQLKKETGLSEIVLQRFEDRLKSSAKATKDHEKEVTAAEKAAAKHALALEKQADALEKLGIVTENQVLKEMAELAELTQHAVDAGVPLEKVLAAVAPRLESLRAKAQASGIAMDVFGDALRTSAAAADKLLDSIADQVPVAVVGISKLPGEVSTLDQVMNAAAIQAQNTAESFKFFGVSTRAQLNQTARDAIAHFQTLKESGQATPEAIADAFHKMEAAIKAAGGTVRTFADEFKRITKELGRDFAAVLGEGIASGDWDAFKENLGHVVAKFMGNAMALAVDFFIPGLGQLLQPLFQGISEKIIGGLAKLFGRGDDGDKERDAFLREMGGFAKLAAQLNAIGRGDLFRRLINADSGKQAEAAIKAINEALNETRAELQRIQQNGGLASRSLRQFLDATQDSAETIEFLKNQTRGAASAIGDFFKNSNVTTQAGATATSSLLAAAVAKMREQGMSLRAVLQEFGPTIQLVQQKLAEAGFAGSDAFNQLAADAAVAAGEITGPILDGVDALTSGLESAHNAGLINQEMFAGLTTEIVNGRQALLDQGVAAEQANRLMQHGLQTIWELQHDFNFIVDEGTQAILDEAEAQGVVGDQFRSTLDRIATATERMADTLERAFGRAGDAAEAAGKRIDGAFRPRTVAVRVETETVNVGDSGPEFGDLYAERAATGGMVTDRGVVPTKYFGIGGAVPMPAFKPVGTDTVPAMLTPGELILNEAQQGSIGAALKSSIDAAAALRTNLYNMLPPLSGQAGTAPSVTFGDITVNGNVPDIDTAREIGREIVREIRHGGEFRTLWQREVVAMAGS